MASRPTSARIRLLARNGDPISTPVEWTPALVELLIVSADWERARLTLQGEAVPVSLRRLGGTARVVADWPRAGPGRYQLQLEGCGEADELVVTVAPQKISPDAYAAMLDDLEARLPAVVALGLQRAGGLAGIALPTPGQSTVAQELVRLRRAVLGTGVRPGLAAVLEALADSPHRVLRTTEFWARGERARRPHPTRLTQALVLAGNLDSAGRPARVLDTRADPTADIYENRLLLAFAEQVGTRLRRIRRVLASTSQPALTEEAAALAAQFERARRRAAFLGEVAPPSFLPERTTMVLLKRPPYRAALEGWLEFHRVVAIRLEEPLLEAPLENLPKLYQLWGTLQVMAALLEAAADTGYRLVAQRLAARDADGVFLRVLPDGRAALDLVHGPSGARVQVIPERTYGAGGALRSISYGQRPDIAVEVTSVAGATRVYLFDPKYKLDGEPVHGDGSDGRPHKGDIDKMHAYRDAIRDAAGRRVVCSAAILYPGPAVRYADGIEALPAYPGAEQALHDRLRETFERALALAPTLV